MTECKIIGNTGHRQRVQDKLLSASDCSAIPDYEFLEMILMRAIPRRDVKPLAKEMLAHFGNLAAVLTASPEELMQFKYVKESAVSLFKLIREASHRIVQNPIKDRPVFTVWDNLVDYCCLLFQNEPIEKCFILYLDSGYRLIRQEFVQKGTTDRVSIYPREILKQALIVGAQAVVVAHNHPSGNVHPSSADKITTEELNKALAAARIRLVDHLIIGSGRKIFSFAVQGLIQNLLN